jgi:hypothetical protein
MDSFPPSIKKVLMTCSFCLLPDQTEPILQLLESEFYTALFMNALTCDLDFFLRLGAVMESLPIKGVRGLSGHHEIGEWFLEISFTRTGECLQSVRPPDIR